MFSVQLSGRKPPQELDKRVFTPSNIEKKQKTKQKTKNENVKQKYPRRKDRTMFGEQFLIFTLISDPEVHFRSIY